MSYGCGVTYKIRYEELLSEYELSSKPFDYPGNYEKYMPGEVFHPELGVRSYTFVAMFRDAERCPYFNEQQLILFDDARLYVSSVGAKDEDQDVIYNLKEMKLSIITRPIKNLIALTDTIVIGLDVEDHKTGCVLKAVLDANGINYVQPMQEQPSFPANYWVCDYECYYEDIAELKLLKKEENIKDIILKLYAYDPYLKKLLSKAIDLGAIEAILEGKHKDMRSTWVNVISKDMNCSESIADDVIGLLCKMYYGVWSFGDI